MMKNWIEIDEKLNHHILDGIVESTVDEPVNRQEDAGFHGISRRATWGQKPLFYSEITG